MRYTIIIERGPTNFSAYAPDFPGCVAAGARSPVGPVLCNWQMQPGAARNTPSLLGMAQDSYHALLMDAGPARPDVNGATPVRSSTPLM